MKPYQCKYCEKCFKKSSSCKRHEISHSGEKPYQCRYCNICFNNSSTSVRHEQIHIKGKSSKEVTSQFSIFSCWICQEELSSQELLLEHYDNNMRPE